MPRWMLPLTLAVSLLSACADPTPTSPAGGASSGAVDERRVGVYSSVIEELVGTEGFEWRRVYVVTELCDDPALPEPGTGGCDDRLSEADQRWLLERLDIDGLRFIDDPTPLYDDRWMQGPPRDVVLTLGPIVVRGDGVRVGASYGCGGLCGSGSTYVLEPKGDGWSVVGRRGPMWIA